MLYIRRIGKIPDGRVKKVVNERIDGVLRWCGHTEKIGDAKNTKMVYEGEYIRVSQ